MLRFEWTRASSFRQAHLRHWLSSWTNACSGSFVISKLQFAYLSINQPDDTQSLHCTRSRGTIPRHRRRSIIPPNLRLRRNDRFQRSICNQLIGNTHLQLQNNTRTINNDFHMEVYHVCVQHDVLQNVRVMDRRWIWLVQWRTGLLWEMQASIDFKAYGSKNRIHYPSGIYRNYKKIKILSAPGKTHWGGSTASSLFVQL